MGNIEERKHQTDFLEKVVSKRLSDLGIEDSDLYDLEQIDGFLDHLNDLGYSIVKTNKETRITTLDQFEEKADELISLAKSIRDEKNPAYSGDGKDYHENFRKLGKFVGVSPMVVWAIYFLKHVSAIASAAKDMDIKQAEPLEERFADAQNYLLFGYSMYKEIPNESEN